MTIPRRPGDKGYQRPETISDLHRPPGAPRPREIKSQQAQLESAHRHGTNKSVKWPMSYKTGQREKPEER
ncbi:MAG TPA: hypothetical protein GXX25_14230 [Desulfotomaculum sp.]|nr:hypothetical protein [Desulfotomaculum sp.]